MKNIHVLPTSQPSRLYKSIDNELSFTDIEFEQTNNFNTNQNIYITNDEEIKDGGWYLDTFNTQRIKANQFSDHKHYGNACKKIILTTDQDLIKDGVQAIDDEFLEWFVKNPSCEEIEVERMFNVVQFTSREFIYKIIIPKIEPKQETLEEAVQKVANSDDFINGALFAYQWIKEKNEEILMENWREGVRFGSEFEKAKEQDKKMYSEEDIKKAYCNGADLDYDIMISTIEGSQILKEWFEQFKNK